MELRKIRSICEWKNIRIGREKKTDRFEEIKTNTYLNKLEKLICKLDQDCSKIMAYLMLAIGKEDNIASERSGRVP